MSYENLLVERAGAVAIVTINRPAKLNALNARTIAELGVAMSACAADPSVRAVVLTGAGDKAFVAGADVAALVSMSAAEARTFSELGHRVGDLIESLSLPVIAAVNGFALGGGCELAMACDFIYAASTARFGQPEARLGVIPGFGGTARLTRRVGIARARELLFTGETIDAAEALRIGLCNRVLEPALLLPEARRTATTIAACAPLAVAAAKRALRDGADRPLSEANRVETEMFAALFSTADLATGMRAFLDKDKHPPKWQGS